MIKLVIFDIGGVLIDFTETDYIHYLHENSLPEVDERELSKFVMPLIEVMEYGTLKVPELERMLAKRFNVPGLDIGWVRGWKKLARPKKDVISIANKLAKKKTVVLLSNVSQSRYAEMEKTIGKLFEKSPRVFASCFLKMRKPGPHIYEYVMREVKVKPIETVFIDNQIENVIGAEKVGIKAIWFRNAEQLVVDLKKLKAL